MVLEERGSRGLALDKGEERKERKDTKMSVKTWNRKECKYSATCRLKREPEKHLAFFLVARSRNSEEERQREARLRKRPRIARFHQTSNCDLKRRERGRAREATRPERRGGGRLKRPTKRGRIAGRESEGGQQVVPRTTGRTPDTRRMKYERHQASDTDETKPPKNSSEA